MEFRAGEHNHSHHIVHIAETKGSTDDEFDFIIGGLGAGVGESEPGSGNVSQEVVLNLLAQFPKHRDSAPLGPNHPLGKGAGNLIRTGLKCQTQIFLCLSFMQSLFFKQGLEFLITLFSGFASPRASLWA